MTRLGVLVTRRFVERLERADHVVEVRRTVELPFAPVPGMILDFDGAGEIVISKIRVRVVPPGHLGLLPLEVEVVGTKEPLDGLEAALAAGWQAEAPAPSPAAVEPGSRPMPAPPSGPSRGPEGVGKRPDGSVLGSPVCRACGATIPRPRRGQLACSPRCRWRLWRARQAEQRRATTSRDEEIRALLETALKKLGESGP